MGGERARDEALGAIQIISWDSRTVIPSEQTFGVCVCVCVCVREREYVCVCARVRA